MQAQQALLQDKKDRLGSVNYQLIVVKEVRVIPGESYRRAAIVINETAHEEKFNRIIFFTKTLHVKRFELFQIYVCMFVCCVCNSRVLQTRINEPSEKKRKLVRHICILAASRLRKVKLKFR